MNDLSINFFKLYEPNRTWISAWFLVKEFPSTARFIYQHRYENAIISVEIDEALNNIFRFQRLKIMFKDDADEAEFIFKEAL